MALRMRERDAQAFSSFHPHAQTQQNIAVLRSSVRASGGERCPPLRPPTLASEFRFLPHLPLHIATYPPHGRPCSSMEVLEVGTRPNVHIPHRHIGLPSLGKLRATRRRGGSGGADRGRTEGGSMGGPCPLPPSSLWPLAASSPSSRTFLA